MPRFPAARTMAPFTGAPASTTVKRTSVIFPLRTLPGAARRVRPGRIRRWYVAVTELVAVVEVAEQVEPAAGRRARVEAVRGLRPCRRGPPRRRCRTGSPCGSSAPRRSAGRRSSCPTRPATAARRAPPRGRPARRCRSAWRTPGRGGADAPHAHLAVQLPGRIRGVEPTPGARHERRPAEHPGLHVVGAGHRRRRADRRAVGRDVLRQHAEVPVGVGVPRHQRPAVGVGGDVRVVAVAADRRLVVEVGRGGRQAGVDPRAERAGPGLEDGAAAHARRHRARVGLGAVGHHLPGLQHPAGAAVG